MPTRPDGTEPLVAHGSMYLRSPERSDIPLFIAWLGDARTSRTLGIRVPLSTPMEEAWFDAMTADQGKTRYSFTACRLDDDRPVGSIGLFDVDLVNGSAGLGLSVGAHDDRGRGYGTDMLLALLGFGFGELRLERIWLEVFDYNPRARRLYERLGFVHEGTFRRAIFRDGRHWDVHRMAVLAGEWRDRADRAQRP
jgi:RimJ/RimL family protein N-acetyltransferase